MNNLIDPELEKKINDITKDDPIFKCKSCGLIKPKVILREDGFYCEDCYKKLRDHNFIEATE